MVDASQVMVGTEAGAAPASRERRRLPAWRERLREPGFLAAVPIGLLLVAGFLGPLVLVIVFAFMPAGSFSILQVPTLANFADILASSYYLSFLSSLFLAAVTVAILLVVCYPLAVAMVRVFGKQGSLLTLLITAPLFVADNLRLTGWMLFLVKGGVVSGSLQSAFGVELDSMLYTTGATLFGLVYIYLPFMLFPMVLGVAMVPPQTREAAFDLGANRFQIMREVDIPLAMPGILIGGLMCFILTAGALTEAKVLGGTAVVTIAQDIQKEFTFAQNWPRGSALSVLMILLAGGLSVALLKRIDLDGIFGRR
ncbi:ABC transporter permease [Labrys wisconsinensis]|uniref:Spermidine/putrescine transport system permease protein n=1 Tax=Labrys wisconsinensis TaxID=425677 RepID=A0ABU0IZP8_9HYPH|nr:ABC transporter permease [Labrys wisconsinensis]MDQ0467486.1 spermidine/putrescine transport system permease protein [Labrys wisconsinensis]